MFLYYKKKHNVVIYIRLNDESNFTINRANCGPSLLMITLEYIDGAILKKNATNLAFIERQML